MRETDKGRKRERIREKERERKRDGEKEREREQRLPIYHTLRLKPKMIGTLLSLDLSS